MRVGSRSFWLALFILVMAVSVIVLSPLYRVALLGSGYMAQTICAGLFVSGRDFDDLMEQDLSGPGLEPLRLFTQVVDSDAKSVRAAVFGLAQQTSVFRNGRLYTDPR